MSSLGESDCDVDDLQDFLSSDYVEKFVDADPALPPPPPPTPCLDRADTDVRSSSSSRNSLDNHLRRSIDHPQTVHVTRRNSVTTRRAEPAPPEMMTISLSLAHSIKRRVLVPPRLFVS